MGDVLIVEDDPGVASLERRQLERTGYRVELATSAEEAMDALRKRRVDLMLLDYRLPGGVDGLEFFDRIRAAGFDVPVILVTAFSNEATVVKALRAGVRDFISKSLEFLEYLPAAVAQVLRQVRTENALAASQARLTTIIDSVKDAIVIMDQDQAIELFNPAAEQMFHCKAREVLGRSISEFIVKRPGETSASGDSLTTLLRAQTRGIRADGQQFPIEATVSPFESGGRRFYSMVIRDVTERERAADALRRSELQFRQIWDNSLDGMRLTDGQGIVRLVNRAYSAMVDKPRESLEGQPLTLILAESGGLPLDAFREQFAERGIEPFVTSELRLWNGRIVHFEVSNSFLELPGQAPLLLSVVREVTARLSLEAQLRHTQKMEGIGRLAGGIAHDFNNMLTVINGYSELLLHQVESGHASFEPLTEICAAGERATALTRQLLAFSRKQMLAPRVLDLNDLVSNIERMLARLVGEDIRIATSLDRTLGHVRVDPGQIEQVLVNLVVNARDAMPKGGRILIETRNLEPEEMAAGAVPPGGSVMLSVSDTGHGMDEATRARVFEPFFTTKEVGQGTGLGLSTVFGIVEQSGGHIEVSSEPGHGARFKISLPRVDPPPPTVASAPVAKPPRGHETILLAEDEEAVRGFLGLSLRTQGYTVLEARDGHQALEIFRQHRDSIDLIVTDVVMPGLSGRELAEQLLAERPALKVLYLSGYTDDAILRHGAITMGRAFLSKPVTPSQLAHKVREILDG
jgi:two-component system cell cycle sensor histidine kinase/response regulator CckA